MNPLIFGLSSKDSNYYSKDGTLQYDRVNNKNRTLTHITKKERIVKSIQKYHNNQKGKKEAYKNFN